MTKGKFKIPIYEYIVEVFIFDNINEAVGAFPGVVDEGMAGCTIEHINEPRCKLVLPPDRMSTVIHELEHVKNLVWKYTGYEVKVDNDEPDAYLMSYLFEQVEKILRRHLASRS